jgi:hypothetical protein
MSTTCPTCGDEIKRLRSALSGVSRALARYDMPELAYVLQGIVDGRLSELPALVEAVGQP